MSGFVLLHRALIGHAAFRNDAEAMAFAWMIMRAAWRPARVRYKGRAISLNRGQLAISQRDMAAALDRDKAWIERLWKRLKSEAMIEATTEAGVAVITICNYTAYQAECAKREAVDEAPREAEARQTRGTEQIREQDNKKEEGAKAPCPPPLADRVVSAWNEGPGKRGATSARTLDSGRRKLLSLREREHGEGAVFEAMRNLAASDFHCGKNDREWRANIGWFLKAENFLKMLEASPPAANCNDPAATAEHLESRAAFNEQIGRADEAAEQRARAARLRATGPPGQPIGAVGAAKLIASLRHTERT